MTDSIDKFLEYLHRAAANRAGNAADQLGRFSPPSKRCLDCHGTGNMMAAVLPGVQGPIACKTCHGSGKERT